MLIVSEDKCDIIRSEMVVAYKLRQRERKGEKSVLIASANNEAIPIAEFDTIDEATTCLKELLRCEAVGCYDFIVADYKEEQTWNCTD